MHGTNLTSGLVPYIACAAVAAFALDYCVQSVGTILNASARIGIQSEIVQPMNIVDRSHKGDRLPRGQPIYGPAASDGVATGNIELTPAKAPPVDAPRLPSFRLELPDGCEPAFSSLTAGVRKNIADRCTT
jgi:hypothetical protein